MFPDLCFLDPEVHRGSVSYVVFGHALLHGFREGESRDTMSHSSRQHQLLMCVVNKYLMAGLTHISV